jgi:4-amino-4-deoxy-L-arabinose transferase-like glycosyltransferase
MLIAFALRLVWNLAIHSPGDYITSDMQSYWKHSNSILQNPFQRSGSAIFFPPGTGFLLSLVRFVFGPDNHFALAVFFAALGTLLVPLVYRIAERFFEQRSWPRLAAILTCFYYPFISYGGYYLSELPFAVCVTAAGLFTVRLADRGQTRDAWLTGLAIAAGALFRPQILAGLPILGVLWLIRRRSWFRWKLKHWFYLAIPIVLIAVLCVGRFRYHTNRWGFISGNGPLNYAFGRCHTLVIESRAVGYFASYSPPPLGYLESRQKRHPDSFVRLDPAVGTKVTLIGTMWSPEIFDELTKRCMEVTGTSRQIRYSMMHVIMLWGFNNAWPDSATDPYRFFMLAAVILHNIFLMPPLLVMLVAAFRSRFSRHALLGAHLAALVLISLVYFGDVRYRVPYDALIMVLALDGWRRVLGWIASSRWCSWR